MRGSNVRRQTRETVSLEKLEEKLPAECFQAVIESTKQPLGTCLDDGIQRAYFEAEPELPLSLDEQKELFEQLGNAWVKNHYSTAELRALLDRPSAGKKLRNHE